LKTTIREETMDRKNGLPPIHPGWKGSINRPRKNLEPVVRATSNGGFCDRLWRDFGDGAKEEGTWVE
jgi:hypothetical protein